MGFKLNTVKFVLDGNNSERVEQRKIRLEVWCLVHVSLQLI
jgi:hypothetical protein